MNELKAECGAGCLRYTLPRAVGSGGRGRDLAGPVNAGVLEHLHKDIDSVCCDLSGVALVVVVLWSRCQLLLWQGNQNERTVQDCDVSLN